MLDSGWSAAPSAPVADDGPGALAGLTWQAARVPGSSGMLLDTGVGAEDLETVDWWYQTEFDADAAEPGEEVVLHLDGIATVAEVYLNAELLLESESMFVEHRLEVGRRLHGRNHLAIRCRALAPLISLPRKPRARWRSKLVQDGGIRWFRTMLLGRMPGTAPGPALIGPWRPIWLERRRGTVVDELRVRARLDGDDGVLSVRALVRTIDGGPATGLELEVESASGRFTVPLEVKAGEGRTSVAGELRIPSVERWWPHTHGRPTLHHVRLVARSGEATRTVVAASRVGFRSLAAGATPDHDLDRDGIDLHLNGVQVFCRGAIWIPGDDVRFDTSGLALRAMLEKVCDAGMNMLRVAGIGAYESSLFHDLCDEMGILVWQDFMFANMDYPFADDGFRRLAEDEAAAVLQRLAGRPSLAVLCGNSEVEQQVAMLGLDPALGRGEFFGSTLPALAEQAGADAVYLPSAPCGGDLPFRADRGVANYFGVGAYRRPLSDARATGVRFASECLAFANVPDDEVIATLVPPPDPRWKAGVPRDAGSSWDFDDVRDHYLAVLFGLDAGELLRTDPARYLDLSRAVSGEVMAEVFGEWRRGASTCGGGLVLWLKDLVPGAGWGLLDHRGAPKVAYEHLRRALKPISVWTTDEGLNGVAVHVANDGPSRLWATLRISLFHDLEQQVGSAEEQLDLPPHATVERNVESMLGHFVDASWAYRFGPPAQDAIVATLERGSGDEFEPIAQSFRFPAGRPIVPESAARLGLEAHASPGDDGMPAVTVRSRRLAYHVRLEVPGFTPTDNSFSLEPGRSRVITLHPDGPNAAFSGGRVTALNLDGGLALDWEGRRR
ncbi:MAG: glycoside hydrolase family 2 protein [Candidatus Limnocylindria bacterium]